MTVRELDDKGRSLLPASIRKKVGARRFQVELVRGKIELIPLEDIRLRRTNTRNS